MLSGLWLLASVTETVMVVEPTSVPVGLPRKVRVAGSKLNQPGIPSLL